MVTIVTTMTEPLGLPNKERRYGFTVRLYRLYSGGARGLVTIMPLHAANEDDAEKQAKARASEYGSARTYPPAQIDYEVVREEHVITRTVLRTGSHIREGGATR